MFITVLTKAGQFREAV